VEKFKEDFETQQNRKFYKGIKEIETSFKPRTDFCKDEKGSLLGNRQKILARLARCFKGILNKEEEDILRQQTEKRNDGRRMRRTKRKNH
jgi:hypothetical protein